VGRIKIVLACVRLRPSDVFRCVKRMPGVIVVDGVGVVHAAAREVLCYRHRSALYRF